MPGPSNLYGVANPVAMPQATIVFGPVACPAGTETTFAAVPAMFAPSGGYYYPIVWVTCLIASSASISTGITIAARIGAGSDFDTMFIVPSGAWASQYVYVSGALLGTPSNNIWQAPGSVINLTANPAVNAISVYNIKYVAAIFRAPDQ